MIRTSSNKVALYARFSSDNQRSESIDAQIRAMQAYCEQHKLVIVETYIDEAKSATTDRRPAFQQMISDSSNHSFNILLVHKLDRFARNRYDSAVYKRELKKNGVNVYSVLENLDDSPESIMMEAVLEGMSEYYSQNLARETMKGLRENALKCRHTGGKPPLGYYVDSETKRLAINEEEAVAVRLIFDMYSQGYGYSAILNELHMLNLRTRSGKDFQKNSLYSILTNPKYQGLYVYNRASAKDAEGRRNNHLYKDNEEIISIKGGCPQIVSQETYEKVQMRICAHKHTGGRANAKENYLFSGKLFCTECGKAMVGNARHSGRNKLLHVTYRCPTQKYACSNKEINRDYIEGYVVDLIEKEILNRRALTKLKSEIEQFADISTYSDKMDKELENVEEALKNVAEAIAEGLISEALINKLNSLEKQKAEIEVRKRAITNSDSVADIDVNLLLSDYNKVKRTPSHPAYKDFIKGFVDRIDVGKYNVKITLKTGLDIFPQLNKIYNVRRQELYEMGNRNKNHD